MLFCNPYWIGELPSAERTLTTSILQKRVCDSNWTVIGKKASEFFWAIVNSRLPDELLRSIRSSSQIISWLLGLWRCVPSIFKITGASEVPKGMWIFTWINVNARQCKKRGLLHEALILERPWCTLSTHSSDLINMKLFRWILSSSTSGFLLRPAVDFQRDEVIRVGGIRPLQYAHRTLRRKSFK